MMRPKIAGWIGPRLVTQYEQGVRVYWNEERNAVFEFDVGCSVDGTEQKPEVVDGVSLRWGP